MSIKKNKGDEKLVTIPESVLLQLVADKLKGRVLFPKMLQEARDVLKKINTAAS